MAGGKFQTNRSYAARVFGLFKATAKEWNDDKCPQLGAALAYYTVFSLAPLVLVLLVVFGLIFGSSEQARELEQELSGPPIMMPLTHGEKIKV